MRLCAAVACLTHTHGERFGKETIIATKNKNMDFILRPWKESDAKTLARHLNNKKIWDNCRDAYMLRSMNTMPHQCVCWRKQDFRKQEYIIKLASRMGSSLMHIIMNYLKISRKPPCFVTC